MGQPQRPITTQPVSTAVLPSVAVLGAGQSWQQTLSGLGTACAAKEEVQTNKNLVGLLYFIFFLKGLMDSSLEVTS